MPFQLEEIVPHFQALESVESKKPKSEKPTKAPTTRPTSKSRPNKKLPTECLLAIVRCCDPNQTAFLPFRCFEVNQCPGLYWVRSRVCSSRVVKMVSQTFKRDFITFFRPPTLLFHDKSINAMKSDAILPTSMNVEY